MTSTELTTGPPPGPTLPTEQQSELFQRDPFGYVRRMRAEYGTIFTLDLGALGNDDLTDVDNNGKWVFLSRPHQLRTMYGVDESVASGAAANQVFFGTDEASVGYIDGRPHRRRRGQIIPALTSRRDYVGLVAEVVDRCVAEWPRGEEIALFPRLQRITSEIIVEIVCGNFREDDRRELAALLPGTESAELGPEGAAAAERAIKTFVAERLDGHLAKSDRAGDDDMLATLLRHAADGDESLTDEVVRDEVFSLLYTGFATTANTLSWVFAEVLAHPAVHEQLVGELDDRFRERPLRRDDFAELKYTEATILETLRLHPVSALNGVRMVNAELEIDGHTIQPGTILVHCAYLLQRSDEVFDQPETFLPRRFLNTRIDPYELGSFGGGSRTCVGRNYAKEEMRVILALVLSSVRMTRSSGVPDAKQQGLFMAPADGARCVVTDS
ncbi:cytochrome P450 [Actinopolyspora erythraea]|uniref:Cytochrome P450 n=1 Tax=Actinopolyspora erythraea TaxID=414996 RepID=A0A099D9B1_9ACTN|nr:cytochrome P450 [Actinopolyspora erythraea]ASU80283.1 cytochrome P450 [Actinopolyspora erythraea]KGI82634.1 hypothetical protein IL38_04215 [Actinopolyspora erythraea]